MGSTVITVDEIVTSVEVTEIVQVVEGVLEPTVVDVSGNSVVQVVEPGAVDVALVVVDDIQIVSTVETVTIVIEASPVVISSGGSGSGTTITHTAVAAVDLSGQRLVVPQTDGTLIYATDATVADLALPVWMTLGAIMAGQSGTVLCYGPATEVSWSWTAASAVYLSALGVMTQALQTVAGGATFLLQVAKAVSPTEIFYDPQMPIVLA